jgi:nucleoside-diphosphate-sugar epimerase
MRKGATMAKPKVLITGASGLIGRLTIAGLREKYDFSGLSRRPAEGIPCLQADICDAAAIRPAFQGMDMVLHLAAYTGEDNWEDTMAVTVMGTLNVFRAAQEAGVKRVVFMSTGSTMCGYEWDDDKPYGKLARGEYEQVTAPWPLIDHGDPPRPDSRYAVGKLFGEACGRWFADRYGMSVPCIRLGAVLDTDRPKLIRHFPGYLSQSDAVQIIEKCMAAPPTLKYGIFDAISENKVRWRDTTPAKEILGWRPTGSSDHFDPDELRPPRTS